MSYSPGDVVADYQVLAILGAGGMGKVYQVRNQISDRVEAMKILLPDLASNEELAERFMREIKLQATLQHPNIAALHTALRHENQMLMLVEYVEGMTLETLIRSGPLRLEEAVDYMAQVLDALAYAHGRGVIHRDLKPANMMLTPEGRIKLLDFGIAKLVADRSLTRTGFLVGSLPYISPEQIEGLSDVDARTDIYSLGVTLYQALTGQVPFLADSEYSLMRKHLQEAPVPPMQVMNDVPPALNDIVMRALEKDRARRFQTAAEMAAALRALNLGEAPTVEMPMAAPPPPPPMHAAMPPPMPASMPPAGMPAVPEARKFSNRGLYLALGSVVTIVVLVVVATQLPKFMGTKAAEPAAQTAVEQPKVEQPQVEQPKVEQPPAVEQPPVAEPPKTQPAQAMVESKPAPARPRGAVTQAQPPTQAPPPVVVQQQQTPAQIAPAQQQQQPPAVQAAPDNSKALAELREQLMLLGTRVSAAQASLNRLKQEQARQGLGLRGDIAALAQRVEFYMDEAEAAIKRGDDAAGKKYLDQAGRETARLESFLGR